jgi:glycosyltransferase involved in cell wall biosynthesis
MAKPRAESLTMPRRVLLVESGPGQGGSAFSLLRLVKSFDRSRYEPSVVVFCSAEPFERIRSLGVPVIRLDFFRPLFERACADHGVWTRARNYCSFYGNLGADALRNGLRLARHIRRNRIDIVHLNNGILENLPAVFAARLAGVPCVSHLRGTEPLLRFEEYFVDWIAAVITLNRTVARDVSRVFPEEKVRLICNGVDLDAFQNPDPERIRREFGLQPGTLAVGTFARVVEGKGIPEFIAAAAEVNKQHGQSRFFIVGNDSSTEKTFEADMRRLARDMGLGRELIFTGWRDDRIDIMAAMDVVLQISTTFPEGMSLAPLEAMALSKPVIVTRIPGYEFCVDEGRNGYIVAPGDTVALAARVLALAHDRVLAERMGREGRRKAELEFDVRLTARRVENVYDRVLGIQRGGRLGEMRDGEAERLSEAS